MRAEPSLAAASVPFLAAAVAGPFGQPKELLCLLAIAQQPQLKKCAVEGDTLLKESGLLIMMKAASLKVVLLIQATLAGPDGTARPHLVDTGPCTKALRHFTMLRASEAEAFWRVLVPALYLRQRHT